MRPERLYLADIIEAADAIAGYVAGLTREAFQVDDLRRSATVWRMIIIGEAAAHVSEGVRKRHSNVPWSDIIGLRHIAVHAYHHLDWGTVWTSATQEVPELRSQIAAILKVEYPGPG